MAALSAGSTPLAAHQFVTTTAAFGRSIALLEVGSRRADGAVGGEEASGDGESDHDSKNRVRASKHDRCGQGRLQRQGPSWACCSPPSRSAPFTIRALRLVRSRPWWEKILDTPGGFSGCPPGTSARGLTFLEPPLPLLLESISPPCVLGGVLFLVCAVALIVMLTPWARRRHRLPPDRQHAASEFARVDGAGGCQAASGSPLNRSSAGGIVAMDGRGVGVRGWAGVPSRRAGSAALGVAGAA